MSGSVEEQLKTKLNLKYSAASTLIQDARKVVDENADDAQVLQEAEKQFGGLTKKKQDEMRIKEGGSEEEPEWKAKARVAAEKREQQWEAEAAAKAAGLPPPGSEPQEEGVTLPPNVIKQTTTTKVGSAEPTVETVTQEKPTVEASADNTSKTICYCVIL